MNSFQIFKNIYNVLFGEIQDYVFVIEFQNRGLAGFCGFKMLFNLAFHQMKLLKKIVINI
jgi:hypothetical protein